jgi:putative acetyltransferase
MLREKMIIRREKKEDFARIYQLVKIGFQTAKVSNGKEQDFVEGLRGSEYYIPELALVAEEGSTLVGHIMLTRTHVDEDAQKHEMLLLAPLTVALEHRNSGIGSKLIEAAFRSARTMGFKSVILVGDPAYYKRFGFKPSAEFGIKNTNGIPDQYVQACEMLPDALKSVKGSILFITEL